MKSALTLFVLPLAVGFSPFASAEGPPADTTEKPPIYLLLGEQRLLSVPGLLHFSIGSGAVRAQPLPNDAKNRSGLLLLKAVEPGPTDLWVWKDDGSAEHRSIEVDKSAMDPLPSGLGRALENLNEIEVYYTGSGVILRGEIRSNEEATRVEGIVRGFPKDVHDETEPSESLLTLAQARLQTWLQGSPFAGRLEIAREDRTLRIFLARGSLRGPEERSQAEKHARAIFPLVQLDGLDSLPDASPVVHFKVFLLELKKSRFHTLGLGWPPLQETAFRVTTSTISNLVQLDLTLQMLEGEGSLRILSNPELVVRAPGDAELFSGGEIPIQTESAYYSSVTWKSFGLLLQLHVTQAAGDKVRLDITTEDSRLDSSISNQKVPGIQSNRMKTQVDARFGQPLLLSGLLQKTTRQEAKGLPLLREIPILGALFGSEDYLNERSELVAILVPSNELPRNPMERITRFLPRGPIPPPRHPADQKNEQALATSPDYPWNVLQ